jgi:hypothetical protein
MLFLDFQTGPSSSSKPKAPPKATPPPATLSSGPVETSSSDVAPAFYVPPDKRVDPSTVEEEEGPSPSSCFLSPFALRRPYDLRLT